MTFHKTSTPDTPETIFGKGEVVTKPDPRFYNSEQGRKDDSTKPRWSLLPLHTIAQVIRVLEFGAKRYQVDNWQHVPEARTRYYNAVMRHVEAWWLGEKNDPDSGLPHLAHAVCSLLFLMWFDGQEADAG